MNDFFKHSLADQFSVRFSFIKGVPWLSLCDTFLPLNPALKNILDLFGPQTVDEWIDQWRKKAVEKSGDHPLVSRHRQVRKERCGVDEKAWQVVDRDDKALGGTGRNGFLFSL